MNDVVMVEIPVTPEAAEALGVSEDTVLRDWRLARTWLMRSLSGREQHA